MKDSGVDWLGKIPAHWKISKLKYLADNVGKKSDYLGGNYIGLENIESWTGKIIFANSKNENFIESVLNFFDENFILFSKLRPYLAKVARPNFSGQCSTELLTILPREIDKNFLFHLMISHGFIFEVDSSTYGTKMPRANWNFISNIKIPLPPPEEQKKIAAFLDKKCSAIDSAVDAAKKMVETLAGYKKSLITETVTKGLNPFAKMIDSGVDWLGEIPAHWKISKLKYVCKIFGRIGFRGYTQSDLVDKGEGAITLSPSNMTDEGMSYKKCSFLSWKKYEESPEIKIYDGDILMVKTGSSYGKSCLVTNLPLESTINPQLLVIKEILSDNKFLSYVMKTTMIKTQIEVAVVGGAIPTISQEKIRNFQFPLPPLDEQKKIADYLDRKCSAIDESIFVHKNLAEKLSEYKKSLIYEVVTGKISV